jgi:hypothetical protein
VVIATLLSCTQASDSEFRRLKDLHRLPRRQEGCRAALLVADPAMPTPQATARGASAAHLPPKAAESEELGVRKVLAQAKHDLFGTKDVQDAITATYVWMADQLGHITLGLGPTMVLCWATTLLWPGAADSRWRALIFVLIGLVLFAIWIYKEVQDLRETEKRAGKIFPFDSADVIWNIKTALLYFAIGGLAGIAVFISWKLLVLVLLLALWPGLTVAYWWLRRKLAFQQANLPYLYRLANFPSPLEHALVGEVAELANLQNRRVWLSNVLFGRDPVVRSEPKLRHLLIAGPLGAGKTSLCVGIGTEFAFALGRGRYVSAAKLVQLVVDDQNHPGTPDFDDGRILWHWKDSDLLLVDDVDAGAKAGDYGAGTAAHLVTPDVFVAALSCHSPTPLAWLGPRRSVWVLGDPAQVLLWRSAIAKLMHVGVADIGIVELSTSPAAPGAPEATPEVLPPAGRLRVDA